MKCRSCARWLAASLALALLPATTRAQTPVNEDLQGLVRVTTRLVESLERRESAAIADRDLLRVQVAVQLLDIRVRQLDSIQEGLEDIDDREQRLQGNLASNEVKIENARKRLNETMDEPERTKLEAHLAELLVYENTKKNELEYLSQRRGTLQSRLAGGEQSVLNIEDLVQAWLADSREPAGEAAR